MSAVLFHTLVLRDRLIDRMALWPTKSAAAAVRKAWAGQDHEALAPLASTAEACEKPLAWRRTMRRFCAVPRWRGASCCWWQRGS